MERTLIRETIKKVGEEVKLAGWVDTVRDHGKITFIDLRDRTGIVQCVGQELPKVTPESVVEIEGKVTKRPEKLVNPNLETGEMEVQIKKMEIVSMCRELPIPLEGDGYSIDEEIRLKYRYLDLRRKRLRKIIELRNRYTHAIRNALMERDFTEVETPMLTKSTKEGARDFVVPSRFYPGKFYALPQSPQQYKQLLMVAGVERYFQLARCIRDEDLRADRGFEHTQVDIEMSFVDQADVMETVEAVVKEAVKTVGGKLRDEKFPVFTYEEAMKKFNADKFDIRNDKERKENMLAFAWVINFPFFKKVNKKDVAEVRDSKSGWTFTHNPFSMPLEEHTNWMLRGEHIGDILTTQYDLVCNGYEAGGGSIRTHDPEILKATFKIMGYSEKEIQESVGHMLEAFSYGAPPHGGIALGLDRQVMIIAGESSLKEVIAFPMTSKGHTAVMDAPNEISDEQLKELGIKVDEFLKVYDLRGKSVFGKILLSFKKLGIDYELYEHEPVYTSEQAAKVRGTKIHQGAKALVLQADKDFIIFVTPADIKVDLDMLQKKLGVKKLRMASKESVKTKTGLEVGAVPPIGFLVGLKTYIDSRLSENDEIAFNAGRHDRSVKIKYVDFVKMEKPEILEM
jgi:aspartyl-tRNA synthetase